MANIGEIGRGFGKNADKWTCRVEISKEEIPGSKRSIYGYIWPTPGLKGRTFKLCVFTRWDFHFCVRSSPLRGKERGRRRWRRGGEQRGRSIFYNILCRHKLSGLQVSRWRSKRQGNRREDSETGKGNSKFYQAQVEEKNIKYIKQIQ